MQASRMFIRSHMCRSPLHRRLRLNWKESSRNISRKERSGDSARLWSSTASHHEQLGPRLVAQDDHPLRSPPLDPGAEPALENDSRSPLERFRTKPKKPLSVTDLISPAWCELQYWYTLTKHGRKRRTPAMKQGSAVHKKLEEEVHEAVEVNVTTKEDMWALKIWNVIQGLRTLRITGMTREMEIWGVIDGQVVNGIIDELSYRAPLETVEGEETIEAIPEDGVDGNTSSGKVLLGGDPYQRLTINDFFRTQGAVVLGEDPTGPSPWLGSDTVPQKQVHITDVKTRGARTLPQGAALRPTKMQLFLYHHILSTLATNSVDPATLFARYSVNPAVPFTDGFIAQVGALDFNFREESVDSSDPPFESAEDSVSELLEHNSLTQLWALMINEYKRAIPLLTPTSAAISPLVKAEFRRAWDGTVLGSKVFRYDQEELDAYVGKEMSWWKGEREAVGVDIEEAYKCGMCEFAEECDWRKQKVVEVVEKVKLRKRGRPRKSGV
ncbi:hypothetical protein EJ05DRAFT_274182 [Pseudovirgaria hyperparasitica]|uniref:Exonuclease V n=1 Tax=Pseudovirgaria hyperparasitica TaxID=470096 RepID=A0A6A6WBE3_9PEZI|nr:uncharacterized protein EJ05DRAFT_274182 [Pseudovirgaria hyperparasitica]KAF2760168.1 hypothetical protein EJ05DRAFT_274182 [Pseudovirgaria hyperparasitica]